MLVYYFFNFFDYIFISINDCVYIFTYIYDYIYINFFINNSIILFYNKYKLVDYYYYIYVNFYWVYRFLKRIIIFICFNLLKLYIFFINDNIFFGFSNYLFVLLIKCKSKFLYNIKYLNKFYFKLRKKYKSYYRFSKVGYLKIFLFLMIFWLFILMWRNRTTYYKSDFFRYIILYHVFVLLLCFIIVPFFYYKFIGVFISLFFVFFIYLLKFLN